jgi:uncharacterized membrane protein (UPF0182 family)
VLLLAAVGLIALLLVGPRLWTPTSIGCGSGEVGFRSVWVTVLLTRVAIFVAVALVVGGTVFVALMLAYRSRPVFVPAARPNDPIAPYRTQVMRRSRLFGWGVAVAVGVLCGLIAQSGCSAVRALSAPNWYAPDSQGRFSRVVDHPRTQVQLRQKN